MYKTFKIYTLTVLILVCGMLNAQTVRKMTVENGGTGAFKAEIVSDSSLTAFTIYRPADLPSEPLPVVLYGNGACMNSSVEARYFLNELASHGYIVIAIGPYNEDDFIAHWTGVMTMMHPGSKQVILADGTEVKALTPEELREYLTRQNAAREAAQKQAGKKKNKTPEPEPFRTYPRQLLEALDWLTDQNANEESEYCGHVDLDKVAVMGQSCGGAQAIAVLHDPRISTGIILNSGMGEMAMQGADHNSLQHIRVPMLYVVGGEADMATGNAAKDFESIEKVPVFMVNTVIDGHEGSYYESHGGKYAVIVNQWLEWQLKGKVGQSAPFLNDDAFHSLYEGWTLDRKNCGVYGE